MAGKYKLYKYEWYDHYSRWGWKEESDIQSAQPLLITGTGYLVGENKLYLFFTQGITKTNPPQFNDLMAVYKPALKSKVLIK